MVFIKVFVNVQPHPLCLHVHYFLFSSTSHSEKSDMTDEAGEFCVRP